MADLAQAWEKKLRPVRLSLTGALATSLAVCGLALTPSLAADEFVPAAAARPMVQQPEPVARGLIVKTTTKRPSGSLLRAAEDALEGSANVVDDSKIGSQTSAVIFDEVVSGAVASETARLVEQRSDVQWAAPDYRMTVDSAAPVEHDDEFFAKQRQVWDRKISNGGYSTKAPAMWKKTEGSPDVRVAVIDTGVLDHPELAGQMVPGYDFIDDSVEGFQAKEFLGDHSDYLADADSGRDTNASDAGDWTPSGFCYGGSQASSSSWHGTFVAGQVAATTDSVGISGIAPGVKIMPVRVLGQCGGWTTDIIAGMTWASGGHVEGVPDLDPVDTAQIINLSLGQMIPHDADRTMVCEAFGEAAQAGRARGSIFVAAAGNAGDDANWMVPASCTGFFSVGATSMKGYSALYSNIGTSVDIVAPGGDSIVEGRYDSVLSLGNSGTKHPSSSYGYTRKIGTSMAAPAVSAAAALVVSAKDSRSTEGVEDLLERAAAPFRKSSEYRRKKVRINGATYYVDLRCKKSWCGEGLLDLSKIHAPLTAPTILGEVMVGETLRASASQWVNKPSDVRHTWLVDGVAAGSHSSYVPARDDIGKTIAVQVRAGLSGYDDLGMTSEATTPVPIGPEVTADWPSISGQGHPFEDPVSVGVTIRTDGVAVSGGVIDIRTRNGRIVASQELPPVEAGSESSVTQVGVEIPTGALKPGTYVLRATYLGDEAIGSASSGEESIKVAPARSATSIKLPRSIHHDSRATLRIRVKNALTSRPTGRIRVYDSAQKHPDLFRISLTKKMNGVMKVKLPKLKKGKHKIFVKYYGRPDGLITRSTSSTLTIRSK